MRVATWIATGPAAFAVRPLYNRVAFAFWKLRGPFRPIPHAVKEQAVVDVAMRYRIKILVETGTYLGDMVWALRHKFTEIHSVELDPVLYRRASQRFRRFSHIHIHEGDSGAVLGQILPKLRGPAVFWLDGHHSGGITAHGEMATPVMREVSDILDDRRFSHVILIDDADQFGTGDYPSISQLQAQTREQAPRASVRVADNIVWVEPAGI